MLLRILGFFLLLNVMTSVVYSASLAISPSNSISISTTGSGSGSTSNTNSNSVTVSGTVSITVTHPLPPAPVNLTNHFPGCALRPDNTNHIFYLCLAWADPSGQSVSFRITYTPTGGTPTTVTSYYPAVYLPGLSPKTTYAISISGVDYAGRVSLPLTGSYTTDPLDAKTAYKTNDLQNVNCSIGISSTTYRKIISCQWGAPPVLPIDIEVKGRCVATGARNKVVHKLLKGTATSVTLPINRATFTCYVEILGTYLNHKANNGHGHRFVINCVSSTNTCTNVH